MNNLSKDRARNLRKNSTKAESLLWQELRRKNLDGKKFYRQFVINFELDNKKRFFIADFYNHESKLVIEVDGKIHDMRKDYDNFRTDILEKLGLKVIRFTNDEVETNLPLVLSKIREELRLKSPLLLKRGDLGES